jgi:radical SAM superfamily enzyme YgiQ (UPF0313 family)
MKDRVLLMLTPNETAFLPLGYITSPPLSLAYLSTALREQGFEPEMVDLRCQLNSILDAGTVRDKLSFLFEKQRILNYISQDDADEDIDSLLFDLLSGYNFADYLAVGISMGADNSLFEIHFSLIIGAYIKRHYNKMIILGGLNVTILYAFRREYKELWVAMLKRFKYIIKGPGERALLELLDGHRNPKSINGLVYGENGHVKANPEFAPIILRPDFDTLPLEYYSIYLDESSNDDEKNNLEMIYRLPSPLHRFVNYTRAQRANVQRRLIIPYIFSHNCPYNCVFCWESDTDKGNVVHGDVQKVVDDIKHLSDKYQSNYFMFLNNAFNSSPAFADKWCNAIVREGIKIHWSDCGRFNAVTLDRLKAMRESGCQKIVFGLETASRKLSKYINKKLDLDHTEVVLQWCKQVGILVDLEIIVGFPYEHEDEFNETMAYLARNRELISYMAINQYYVLPNSLLGRYPEKYGIRIIESQTYDQILENNSKSLMEGADNFRIHRYVETDNQRTAEEIERDSLRRFIAIGKQQSPCFGEIEKEYRQAMKEGRIARDAFWGNEREGASSCVRRSSSTNVISAPA